MNIKVRAAGRTAGMFAIATLVPVVMVALFQLDAETLFNLFLLSFFAGGIWVVYSINLSTLESEETIKQMQERRETMLSNIVKDPE
jgi:nitrogen fixation/metabolism regulation signal transduction histidine kinase